MSVYCYNCQEEKKRVDEPEVSGFSGYVCTNEGCPIDQ